MTFVCVFTLEQVYSRLGGTGPEMYFSNTGSVTLSWGRILAWRDTFLAWGRTSSNLGGLTPKCSPVAQGLNGLRRLRPFQTFRRVSIRHILVASCCVAFCICSPLLISEEIRLIFGVQLYYSKMIESLSESNTDNK